MRLLSDDDPRRRMPGLKHPEGLPLKTAVLCDPRTLQPYPFKVYTLPTKQISLDFLPVNPGNLEGPWQSWLLQFSLSTRKSLCTKETSIPSTMGTIVPSYHIPLNVYLFCFTISQEMRGSRVLSPLFPSARDLRRSLFSQLLKKEMVTGKKWTLHQSPWMTTLGFNLIPQQLREMFHWNDRGMNPGWTFSAFGVLLGY